MKNFRFVFLFILFILFSNNIFCQNASNLLNEQSSLLEQLESQWNDMNLQLKGLKITSDTLLIENTELSNKLKDTNNTILNLKENLENYKKALQANKEDTSYIIGLFADAQNELSGIKEYVVKLENDKRHLRNTRITTIAFTGLGAGTIILANSAPINDDNVKMFLQGLGIGMTAVGGVTLGFSFLF